MTKLSSKQKRVFFEIHRDNPREGPGNLESTARAFGLLQKLPDHPRILDIGCGPGKQTLHLARLSKGEIHAVDLYGQYLEQLRFQVKMQGLEHQIFLHQQDMASLGFERESFDAIWAEGAIYIIGFEKGLELWKPLLKSQGYIAVSELSWLQNNPPAILQDFFSKEYPAMKSIPENLDLIRQENYRLCDHFTLPESAWWDDYYQPLKGKISSLKEKYRDDPEALEVLRAETQEIDLYRQFRHYYGYVFYIMQKND